MLNFNLTKNEIGYLRLLIDIQSCDDEKKSTRHNDSSDSDMPPYARYDNIFNKSIKNS